VRGFTAWLPLIVALVLNAAANVLMKVGSKTARELPPDATLLDKGFNFLNVATLAGLVLFAANVLAYRKALDNLNLSVAYPIMVSVGMVLVTLAAWGLPILRERIGPAQIAGMVLIAAGVWLVARNGQPAG
jgi:multidrug transporter EmrE-like cation transporter